MSHNYSLDIVFTLIFFLISLSVINFISTRLRVFSNIIWVLLFGVVYGILSTIESLPLPPFAFEQETIFFLFIPPLIFASAQKICLNELRTILFSANLLATVGVSISMIIIGAVLHFALAIPWDLALLFGVVMSATDPLAIAALLSKNTSLSEEKKLFIEAESILNDGFVVTAFGVLLAMVLNPESVTIQSSIVILFRNIFGAVIIGIALGRFARFILQALDQGHFIGRFNITLVLSYGSFVLAEHFHISGILAVFCAALSYGYKPIKTNSDEDVKIKNHLWEYTDNTVNAALFFLLGANFATLVNFELLSPFILLIAITLIATSRLASIYCLWPVLKINKKRLSHNDMNILNLAGSRGAVSIALLLILPNSIEHKEHFLSMAFVMVLFTLIVYPLCMQKILASKQKPTLASKEQ